MAKDYQGVRRETKPITPQAGWGLPGSKAGIPNPSGKRTVAKAISPKNAASLSQKLLSLKDMKIEHVCLFGYEDITSSRFGEESQVPLFLTKDRRAFLLHLGAEAVRGNTTEVLLSTGKTNVRPVGEETAEEEQFYYFQVVETGKLFFPSRFEGELLKHRIIYKDCLYVADSDGLFWATLYHLLVHQGKFLPHEEAAISLRLKDRMGVFAKCKYDDVEHKTVVSY